MHLIAVDQVEFRLNDFALKHQTSWNIDSCEHLLKFSSWNFNFINNYENHNEIWMALENTMEPTVEHNLCGNLWQK